MMPPLVFSQKWYTAHPFRVHSRLFSHYSGRFPGDSHEEGMTHFPRVFARYPRRRRALARAQLETLEVRAMLSTAGPTTTAASSQTVNVPTVTTLTSTATSAETGQSIPLSVTVKNASTGPPGSAASAQPTKGKVEFFTNGPNPVLLGTANLRSNGQAALSTNAIKTAGTYQIQAEFLPAHNFFAASASAPITMTITNQTLNAPTVTTMESPKNVIEAGEPLTMNVTVQNDNSSIPDGIVKFSTVSAHPIALGAVGLSSFGQQVSIASYKLQKVGIYQVQARYVPSTNRFAESFSTPLTVAVTPRTVTSFRVTPVVLRGKLNKPVSFDVTALNKHGKRVTSYTGTIVFTSPTDTPTVFSPQFYSSLKITPSPPQTTGLAEFNPETYTFTAADQGSHRFIGGVTFGKAGAERIKVHQANDPKVFGKATFAIG
jgi:hypothetical protein